MKFELNKGTFVEIHFKGIFAKKSIAETELEIFQDLLARLDDELIKKLEKNDES